MRIFYIGTKFLSTIILLAIFLFIVFFIFYKEYYKAEQVYLPITNKVIGIDPGHGGVDPGAVSKNGVLEDEINLKIALKLKKFIEQSGGIAVLTRRSDEGLYTDRSTSLREKKTEDLTNRKALIEAAECEVFISIHLNSFTDSRYKGAQTFYNDRLEESIMLANIMQDELRNVLDKDNHRVPAYRDDVYLITSMDMPSVLVEAGFLSNLEEEKLLTNAEYQGKIAWAIYAGIMKYFSQQNIF